MRSLQRTAIILVVPILSVAWLLGACDTDVTISPPPPDASADGAAKDASGDATPSDGAAAEAGPKTDAEPDGEVAEDSGPDSEAADAAHDGGDAGDLDARTDATLDASGE
jgi:hypothetical protein